MSTAELYRLLCNLIRVGTVSEIDLSDSENPRVRVTTGDNTTDWIRWMTTRAGKAKRWCAPVKGEQILLLAAEGDMNNAIIIGSLFSSAFPPPDSGADTDVISWPDGAACRYDTSTQHLSITGINTLTITTDGPANVQCKSAVITADDSITLDTKEVVCTQKLTAAELSITKGGELHGAFTGSMTINGVKPDDHGHGGVEGGDSWTKGIK